MLHVQNISYQYSDSPLLKNIDFAINPGEVIALLGENGSGKTTILQLILGELQPDEGSISRSHEVAGYVPQEPLYQQATVRDSFHNAQLWQIEYALSLVSLDPSIYSRPVSSLSGGQKTRLALAQVLATDPSPTLLLLDEPTNNIDAEGLQWLQQFISDFEGGILLVSHDRSFINSVATKVIALKNCTVKQYGGDYDFYVQQRAIEREKEQQRYQAYLDEKLRLEKLIRSAKRDAKHGTRRKKAPDGDKCLWTFKNEHVQRKAAGRSKALEARLDKIDRVERPDTVQQFSISLSGTVPASKLIVQLEKIDKMFGSTSVLKDNNLTIRGGERLHIQGKNGSGKSTLLKIVAEELAPTSGTVKYGTGLNVGYFSQESDVLDYTVSARTNLETCTDNATQIYRAASHFGLSEKDIRKLPSELSRGQQAKLAFARLLLGDFQLLVLDEPTNHLDISTKERLESALIDYQGALIVASHDKYFTKKLKLTHTYIL